MKASHFVDQRLSGERSQSGVVDWTRFISDSLMQPVAQGYRQAAANLLDAAGSYAKGAAPAQRQCKTCGGSCSCCMPDPCHCQCCIVDSDAVIYGRLGERRVIQMAIDNKWRRERHISMELSRFKRRGGGESPVDGKLLPPAPEFTLPPCGSQRIIMVVLSDYREAESSRGAPSDVDDCVVSYADLRVDGCDIRPLRIAVALMPRDCSEYNVTCGCECCC